MLNFFNGWYFSRSEYYFYETNRISSITPKFKAMNFFQKNKHAILSTAALVLMGGIALSFQDSPFNYLNPYNVQAQADQSDTVPDKKCCGDNKMTMKEFEKLPETIDLGVQKAGDALKNIDWASIEKTVNDALKNVDVDKIKLQIENAMKEVDFAKISADISKALKEVDMKKLDAELKTAMEEARKELSEIKLDEIKKEMDNAKLEIEKSKDEIKKIDFEKIMKEAKDGIEKAKTELKNYKLMFDEMEKDGLISKKAGFSVEFKNKELFINDKKQTEEVTKKYSHYFKEDHFNITIEKENE